MKKKNVYQDYFTKHYNLSLTGKDVVDFECWFGSQWNLIKQFIALKPYTHILEVGSGIGGFYSFLNKTPNINYTGIELDNKAVTFANHHFSTKNFKHISLEEFKTDKKYDYVFAFEVLEHLEEPLSAINRIYSLLQPGGYFIGTTPYPFAKNIVADKTHLFVLHPQNWERLFSLAAFTDISTKPMSFFPFLWRLHPPLNIRIPFYVPFPTFISTTLIVAKKK